MSDAVNVATTRPRTLTAEYIDRSEEYLVCSIPMRHSKMKYIVPQSNPKLIEGHCQECVSRTAMQRQECANHLAGGFGAGARPPEAIVSTLLPSAQLKIHMLDRCS